MNDDYDPPGHERVYYRHTITGDLGYLVRREGKDYIRLDRPAQDISKPFLAAEWIAEQEYRPLSRMQLVQIAFEADKKLCILLGLHDEGRKQWLNLRDEERIAWAAGGPPAKGGRKAVFLALMKALEEHAGR